MGTLCPSFDFWLNFGFWCSGKVHIWCESWHRSHKLSHRHSQSQRRKWGFVLWINTLLGLIFVGSECKLSWIHRCIWSGFPLVELNLCARACFRTRMRSGISLLVPSISESFPRSTLLVIIEVLRFDFFFFFFQNLINICFSFFVFCC